MESLAEPLILQFWLVSAAAPANARGRSISSQPDAFQERPGQRRADRSRHARQANAQSAIVPGRAARARTSTARASSLPDARLRYFWNELPILPSPSRIGMDK